MTRATYWKILKNLNPSTGLKYKTSTLSQLKNAILNAQKVKNSDIAKQIKKTKLNSFIKKHITQIKSKSTIDDLNKNNKIGYSNLYNKLNKMNFNGIRAIQLIFNDGSIETIDIKQLSPTQIFSKIKSIIYMYSEMGLLLIDIKFLNDTHEKIGKSRDGVKNCVIQAIDNHLKHKTKDQLTMIKTCYSKFQDGVAEFEYGDISTNLNVDIVVHTPTRTLEFNKRTKCKLAKLHLYYHNNHVYTKEVYNVEKDIIYLSDKFFQIDNKNKPINNDIFKQIKGDIISFVPGVYIETTNYKYQIKEQDGIDLQVMSKLDNINYMTSSSYLCKQFIKNNNIIPLINNDNYQCTKTFAKHGIHHSEQITDDAFTIDLKQAYTNFMNFEDYTGIPCDITHWVRLPVDEMKHIIYTREGFARIEINDFFSNEKIINWFSFPYVRHAFKSQRSFVIHEIAIANSKTDLNLSMFKNAPKRSWHYTLGKMVKTVMTEVITTTDDILATSHCAQKIISYNDKDYYNIKFNKEFNNSQYYPHITGYVQDYVMIEMEKMIMKINKPIVSCIVDGISYEKKYFNHVQSFINSNWHPNKKHHNPEAIYKNKFPFSFSSSKHSDTFINFTLESNNTLITGYGGCGKSYKLVQLSKQLSNYLTITPTYMVNYNLQNDGIQNISNVQKVIANIKNPNTTQKRYNVILIDEISMFSLEEFNVLKNYFYNSIFVSFGQFGQLPNFVGTQIQNEHFQKIHVLDENINYRHADKSFYEKTKITFKTGILPPIQGIDVIDAIKNKMMILCSTHQEINRINKIGLEHSKVIPVRILKSNTKKNYITGDIGEIIEEHSKGALILNYRTNEQIYLNKEDYSLAFGMTYHVIQGITIDPDKPKYFNKYFSSNIVLNPKNLIDKEMKYVGISRVKYEKNLYLLLS